MPAETILVFIRHGTTEWNRERRIQGHIDSPLSELGRRQADQLAQALARAPLAAVYTSDLIRAVDTARPLAAALGRELQVDVRLRERHFGLFQGHTYDEAEAKWPQEFARFTRREPSYTVPGGESTIDQRARLVAGLADIVARHPGESVAVVTHGGVLDLVYRMATGLAAEAPRAQPIPNAGINRIAATLPGPRLRLIDWGVSDHLVETLDELG